MLFYRIQASPDAAKDASNYFVAPLFVESVLFFLCEALAHVLCV